MTEPTPKTASTKTKSPAYSIEQSAGNYLKTSGIGSCKLCGEKKATTIVDGEVTVFCPKADPSCPML